MVGKVGWINLGVIWRGKADPCGSPRPLGSAGGEGDVGVGRGTKRWEEQQKQNLRAGNVEGYLKTFFLIY